jgi:putative phosphoribosyl transferase
VTLEKISKIFSSLKEGSCIQFKNREKAAESLSYLLKKNKKFTCLSNQLIIIGIPRGGTIIGDIIARNLKSSFDIILPQRLISPNNRESTIGSIMKDGSTYLNYKLIREIKISDKYLEKEKYNALEEIDKKELLYGKQIIGSKIRSNIVILVDDGAITGSTLVVASRWIKKFQPKSLTLAIPVCPKETIEILKSEVEDVQSLINPSLKNFNSVSKFYKDFLPLNEKYIKEIIDKYKNNVGHIE